MVHLIDKDALVAEIERLDALYHTSKNLSGDLFIQGLFCFLDTLEAKEVDLENYDKVKKLLSLSFMHFLDANRPVGKMCLSNGECFDIDKAFDKLNFSKLFRYMEKYLKAHKGE